MKNKRFAAIILAVVLTALTLAGCGRSVFSKVAAKEAVIIQGQTVVIEFKTANTLDNALRRAAEAGDAGDILADLLEELGYRDAVPFSVSGLASARAGQHAVGVYAVTDARDASDAAKSAAAALYKVIQSLNGEYTGVVSMVKKGGVYYIAVDVTVVKTGGSGDGSSGGDSGPVEEPAVPIDLTQEITGWGNGGPSAGSATMTVTVTAGNSSIQTELVNAVSEGNREEEELLKELGAVSDVPDPLKEGDQFVFVDMFQAKNDDEAVQQAEQSFDEMSGKLPAEGTYTADVALANHNKNYYFAAQFTVENLKLEERKVEIVSIRTGGFGLNSSLSWFFSCMRGDKTPGSTNPKYDIEKIQNALKTSVGGVAQITDTAIEAELYDKLNPNDGTIWYVGIPDPTDAAGKINEAFSEGTEKPKVEFVVTFVVETTDRLKTDGLLYSSVNNRFKEEIGYANTVENGRRVGWNTLVEDELQEKGVTLGQTEYSNSFSVVQIGNTYVFAVDVTCTYNQDTTASGGEGGGIGLET